MCCWPSMGYSTQSRGAMSRCLRPGRPQNIREVLRMSFHDLHHRDIPLVLPNAWDVPSALTYLSDGFTAIGTTSFGVASSAGHPDGGRTTRDANRALAAALTRLPCYVTVDIEDGYSD